MAAKKFYSQTLWALFAIVFLASAFLGVYVWMVNSVRFDVVELANAGKDVPTVYSVMIQNFPIGALISSLGWAVSLFIGGNKARNVVKNLTTGQGETSE